jgi:hypothetical protein
MKNQWLSILIVAMTLGTAWAIRGQFGHQQGAAWAGSIGAMGLVLVSQRPDWYAKIFKIAVAAAVGWGIGGMISYGVVVGYGKSYSFPNAWYGLSMLFVIGGIFGLLGGGLTGLVLESTEEKKVKWEYLILETAVGGYLTYYILIDLLGIKMTPPRSEAWAICFGGGLTMIWHMVRNGFTSALRVALYSMLGAGFGFGFGDFLQTMGLVMAIDFNMWNVMEYSIGFFGGIGWAYSVFTSKWPESAEKSTLWENRIGFLFLMFFIPVVIFQKNFHVDIMMTKLDELSKLVGYTIPDAENIARLSNIATIIILLILPLIVWFKAERSKFVIGRSEALFFFVVYFSMFMAASFIMKGVMVGIILSNHYLYVVNLIIILILLRQHSPVFTEKPVSQINLKAWSWLLGSALIALCLLALLSSSTHKEGDIEGVNQRFPYIEKPREE